MNKLIIALLLLAATSYGQNKITVSPDTNLVTVESPSFFCYFKQKVLGTTDVLLVCAQRASQGGKVIMEPVAHLFEQTVAWTVQVNNRGDSITIVLQRDVTTIPFNILWQATVNNIPAQNGQFVVN